MKININEIIGEKFGKWTIISADRNSSYVVECKTVCECGIKGKQDYVELKLGRSTKCRQCVIKEKQEENDKIFIGNTFGTFTVLSFSRTDKHGKRLYNIRCQCGLEREMNGSIIKRGKVKTCQNCFEKQTHPRFKDLTNQRFGKLVAMKTIGKNNRGYYLWETKCDCGIISVKDSGNLISGCTTSCGCLIIDNIRAIGFAQKGELSPSWKGGSHDDIRSTHEYNQWIKHVLEKDKYKCQICDSIDNPECHHLYAIARYPEKALDINNGVVLCKPHHTALHSRFGRGDNTPDQFHQFKQDVLANNI